MIIMQHTAPGHDTVVHDDGTIYTNGELNTVGVAVIVDGVAVSLDVNGDGSLDVSLSDGDDLINV